MEVRTQLSLREETGPSGRCADCSSVSLVFQVACQTLEVHRWVGDLLSAVHDCCRLIDSSSFHVTAALERGPLASLGVVSNTARVYV